MATPTVAVVGAGITGLAAAWELSHEGGLRTIVLEGGEAVGGKLRSVEVAGHLLDVGAESMLARRPEAVDLLDEAGLAAGVVHPRRANAGVWSRGKRWPLPPRTVMGVPSDPSAALGLLSAQEVGRAKSEAIGPPLRRDVSVGDFVADRVGPAVVDRLVEPLLAGVYAGHAHRLSLQATVPALWQAATAGTSLVAAAAAATEAADHEAREGERPVFAGYRGGMGQLATDLAERVRSRGVHIRTRATARQLERTSSGWRLTLGPTVAPETLDVEGVVLAIPAAPASRLLRPVVGAAADDLAAIEYASVAVVTLAFPRRAAAGLLTGSGFLVPPTEPLTIKAATFSGSKWSWVDELDPDLVLLRASIGRARETAVLQRDDRELVEMALTDLRTVLGAYLPDPLDAHVQRWGGALPQYAVGHLDRVARVLQAAARQPALAVAGAAYEGVGIPACIGSGRHAARQVAAQVRRRAGTLRE